MEQKSKKIPERTCVVCRTKGPKANFIKVVKTADGIFVDKNGKTNGRGMYICKNKECISEAVKKRAANRVFKCECPAAVYEELGKIDEFD